MTQTDRDLHDETRRIWDANAAFWDGYFREGNDFQLKLVGPSAEALLALQPGQQVLEIACGNGAFSRRMADLGCRVVASDFSAVFVEKARARSQAYTEHIQYMQCDATSSEQLLGLAQHVDSGRYDALVCNMALMDMSDIAPLMQAVPRLLKPEGRFVFTIMHPCFNNPAGTVLVAEQVDQQGELVLRRSVKTHQYLTPTTALGLGIRGQPEAHYYFHRSLTTLLAEAFAQGLVMDGLLEPAFGAADADGRALSWGNLHEIPPVLAVRLRPARPSSA